MLNYYLPLSLLLLLRNVSKKGWLRSNNVGKAYLTSTALVGRRGSPSTRRLGYPEETRTDILIPVGNNGRSLYNTCFYKGHTNPTQHYTIILVTQTKHPINARHLTTIWT